MKIALVLDNIRSIYNVGSIFRTADGAGVDTIYLCGITAYPKKDNDPRKPWEVETISKKIAKTALGSEATVCWEYFSSTIEAVNDLKNSKYQVIALEKNATSKDIYELSDNYFQNKIAVIVGNEVDGVSEELLMISDDIVHIPMYGKKESLNVSVAVSIAIYELKRRINISDNCNNL